MDGLAALERQVARDLALVAYPADEWVKARHGADGSRLLDVLIVGAGQGGVAVAARLTRDRVTNIKLIDRAPAGREGVWRDYARMKTLRSPKEVTGPDLDMPSLTFQAWYEAQHGPDAFARLNKIAKEDWQDYLFWMRRVLDLPVENGVTLERLEPADDHIVAHVRRAEAREQVRARKVVLAMGIETSGRWWVPPEIEALPPGRRAHTGDAIDFTSLRGRRVAVIGAGASAFDNAATALEAGAAHVSVLVRRAELQRVQPFRALSYVGFLRHLGDLDDARRWRIMNHLLSIRESLPAETWARTTVHTNFALLTGHALQGASMRHGQVSLETSRGRVNVDFVIAGTGFDVDLTQRPELAGLHDDIALWRDRYTPPADEVSERLGRYPYLGPGLQFTEKHAGRAPWLARIHCFNFGSTMSFGPCGSSINAMKFAVPRLASAITRDLFLDDADAHLQTVMAYDEPQFDMLLERDRIVAAAE